MEKIHWLRNFNILGSARWEKSTKAEPDSRPLGWLSWPWEVFWEFNMRLLGCLPLPMWRNLCGHWQDLFWKQISFNLAVFGKDESNFRKNNIMFQFSSVTQSCPTLCDPMNRSTPGLPVRQQLPESTQTHVHWVSDAIQPSHPLSSPSPPALNLSQHQGLF